jgi:DNA-binding transcriptional LysR family regulator
MVKMLMEFQDLRYILEIARMGSLSRAAEEMGITQSAMSHALKRVEKEFGGKIFSCGHNGAEPTDFGKYFLEEGEQVLSAVERFQELMRRRLNPVEYQLRIGITPFYEKVFLPLLTKAFANLFPLVNIEFVSDRRNILEQKTRDGELDFSMIPLPVRSSVLASRELFREEILLILSKQHPLLENLKNKRDPSLSLTMCKDETFVFADYDPSFQKFCTDICRKLGFSPQCTFGITSPDAIHAIVANIMGVGFLPASVAEKEWMEGIVCCRIEEDLPMRRFGVVYRKDLPLQKAAQEFIRIAKNVLEPSPPRW